MKKIFLALIIFLIFGLINQSVWAISQVSPSSQKRQQSTEVQNQLQFQEEEQEKQSSPSLNPNLKQKVNQIREELKEKVQERIQQLKKPKGFAGKIIKINQNSFTLETKRKTIEVLTDENTKFVNSQRKEITFSDLKIGNFVIAMGYLNEEENLQAKRIVVINPPKALFRKAVFGKVEDISIEEKIITLKNEKNNTIYTIEANNNTKITKKIDKNVKKISFSEIEIGDRIIAVGTIKQNQKNTIIAKIIHVTPGKAIGQKSSPASSATTTPSLNEEE